MYRYNAIINKKWRSKLFCLLNVTKEKNLKNELNEYVSELETLKKEQIILIDMINKQRKDSIKNLIRINMRNYEVGKLRYQHFFDNNNLYREDLYGEEILQLTYS